MAEEQRTLHRENQAAEPGRGPQLRPPATREGFAEMHEIEILLRATEPHPPAQPSLETWTRFNEHLMRNVAESSHRRATLQERRQRFYDRFTASDSRLKERAWVIVSLAVLAIAAAVAYLVFVRQQ